MPAPTDPVLDFDEAWSHASRIDGWLTRSQARRLYDAARAASPGSVVEIGSHLGRSTIVLAASGASVTAIDPFSNDWRYGRCDTEARFRSHLSAAGLDRRVDLRVETSGTVLEHWSQPVRMVYVDGKHDVLSCLHDLGWSAWLRPGDPVLVHDAFSSVGVTMALLHDALTTRRHVYVGRTGSLAMLEVGRPSVRDRARVLRELPWFTRNLVVKVLLRLRARPAARLLGHHDTADPY